ncbi:MAG: response regulator, partial [Xanthomonadaceae bacterium]|nr:response regulator [Xanthomonadaceae bacterium]
MADNPAKILIVDDEQDICDLVSDILQDEGYEVAVAYNGAEANALKESTDPDLILLDIWMPDIDGISLLKSWREAGNMAPVIMMSGHGTLEHAIEATKLGASDFLE